MMIPRSSKRGEFLAGYGMPFCQLWIYITKPVHRYRTYVTQTMPIIDKFEKRGLVRTISAVPGPEKASLHVVLCIL